jgi:hypothetical protein
MEYLILTLPKKDMFSLSMYVLQGVNSYKRLNIFQVRLKNRGFTNL